MRSFRVSACAVLAATALAGCLAPDVEHADGMWIKQPQLVSLAPDVLVVGNIDEPVFHVRGDWWLFRRAYWYRADSLRGGFTRVDFMDVPMELLAIERPERYGGLLRRR